MSELQIPGEHCFILLDWHDVVAPEKETLLAFANRELGLSLTLDDYKDNWGKMFGMPHYDDVLRFHEDFIAHATAEPPKPYPDALDAIPILAQEHRIGILSYGDPRYEPVILGAVDRFLSSSIEIEDVHVVGVWSDAKAYKLTKGIGVYELGADALVDDMPRHAKSVARLGGTALLFGDYPWNRGAKLADGEYRTPDWRSVVEFDFVEAAYRRDAP